MGELAIRLDREYNVIMNIDNDMAKHGWRRLKGDTHWTKRDMICHLTETVLSFTHHRAFKHTDNYIKSYHHIHVQL